MLKWRKKCNYQGALIASSIYTNGLVLDDKNIPGYIPSGTTIEIM